MKSRVLLCFLLAAVSACSRVGDKEAYRLVNRYNAVVCEAYRRGDVELIDSVVGPNEGEKLAGLIGVRLDAGITLDAELLSLEVKDVKQAGPELSIQTSEQWRYRNRKIGTGDQVGQESLDSYAVLYLFKRIDEQWLVDEIRFIDPPLVGR